MAKSGRRDAAASLTRRQKVAVALGGLVISAAGAGLALLVQTLIERALVEPASVRIVAFDPGAGAPIEPVRGSLTVENDGGRSAVNCVAAWVGAKGAVATLAEQATFYVPAGQSVQVTLVPLGTDEGAPVLRYSSSSAESTISVSCDGTDDGRAVSFN